MQENHLVRRRLGSTAKAMIIDDQIELGSGRRGKGGGKQRLHET